MQRIPSLCQYNINIGTSGWIATVSPEPFTDKPGAANLAFGVEEGFVNAVPFLNAGDVHKWVTGVFSDGDYAEAHQLIETSKPGSNGMRRHMCVRCQDSAGIQCIRILIAAGLVH